MSLELMGKNGTTAGPGHALVDKKQKSHSPRAVALQWARLDGLVVRPEYRQGRLALIAPSTAVAGR